MRDDFADGICSDVCQENEILILVVPHEDIGFTQGPSDMSTEFINGVVEFRVSFSVFRSKREQDFVCIDVVSDDVSDNVAVNRSE